MVTIIPIISVILFLGFLANRLNKKDNSKEELNQQYDDIVNSMYESANDSDEQTQQDTIDSMKQEQNQPDTLELMFRTLCNLGCQPTKNEDGTLSRQLSPIVNDWLIISCLKLVPTCAYIACKFCTAKLQLFSDMAITFRLFSSLNFIAYKVFRL